MRPTPSADGERESGSALPFAGWIADHSGESRRGERDWLILCRSIIADGKYILANIHKIAIAICDAAQEISG